MNLNNLQHKLVAVARTAQPDERVPYAFEKRIMAVIGQRSAVDALSLWSTALWRAAVTCVLVVVLSGAMSLWSRGHHRTTDLSQEFETAVFASVASSDGVW
jgi:hypothetical protein